MKLVKTILNRGRRMRENDGGVNLTKVHCKLIWKCHNETSVQLVYTNINVKIWIYNIPQPLGYNKSNSNMDV
jgi:hypothetical protein